MEISGSPLDDAPLMSESLNELTMITPDLTAYNPPSSCGICMSCCMRLRPHGLDDKYDVMCCFE
jgi:hypothetical protein